VAVAVLVDHARVGGVGRERSVVRALEANAARSGLPGSDEADPGRRGLEDSHCRTLDEGAEESLGDQGAREGVRALDRDRAVAVVEREGVSDLLDLNAQGRRVRVPDLAQDREGEELGADLNLCPRPAEQGEGVSSSGAAATRPDAAKTPASRRDKPFPQADAKGVLTAHPPFGFNGRSVHRPSTKGEVGATPFLRPWLPRAREEAPPVLDDLCTGD
jgi:hypothetical protein